MSPVHALVQAPVLLPSAGPTFLKAQSIQQHAGKEREDQAWEAPGCSTWFFFHLDAIGQNSVMWPHPLQGSGGRSGKWHLVPGRKEEQILNPSSLRHTHEAQKE